jgi:hypothetical protein
VRQGTGSLALRAETTRRIEQLRSRIVDNARYQEGEEPAEDAARLLAQTGEACAELHLVHPAAFVRVRQLT